MARESIPLHERIIEAAIKLIGRNTKQEVTLNDLTEILGVSAPVIYNSYKGIKEINQIARKKISEMIKEISAVKLPKSFPANLLATTIAFHLIKFFEETNFSTNIIIDEEDPDIDMNPLRKRLESLFSEIKGLRYDPALSVNILLYQIAAHVEYSRKSKTPVPEDLVEVIFKTLLYK